MKIAVPVKNNNTIDDHFGHCEFYNIYTVSDTKKIQEVETLKSGQGCGCKSNIASVLANSGVTIMLAGGIGAGAINVLNSAGIEVIRGCSGIANEIVEKYLEGFVIDSGSSCQQHNAHTDGDHVCNH